MKSVQQAKLWGAVTALILIGLTFFLLKGKADTSGSFGSLSFDLTSGDANTLPREEIIDGRALMGETATYRHPTLGFAFKYPKGFTVAAFPEGEAGEMVLVQDSVRAMGFQIFVSVFDEEGPLTSARIQEDIPDLVMKETEKISVARGGSGVTFISDEENPTREVWFVKGNNLYQMSSPLGAQSLLQEVLKTWTF